MAVTNMIAQVWGARLHEHYGRMSPWRAMVEDMSSQLPYGDRINVNTDDTASTAEGSATSDYVADYVAGTAVTYETPDSGRRVVTLSEKKVVRQKIEDTDARQVRPSLMDSYARKGAQDLAVAIGDFIREQAIGAASIGGAATSNLDTSAVLTKVVAGSGFTNASASGAAWETFRENVVERFFDAALQADKFYWPREGRVAILHPNIYRALDEELFDKGLQFSSDANDRAFLDYVTSRTAGWAIMQDPGIPETGANAFRMYFLRRGDGLGYVEQAGRVENLRDKDDVATFMRQLWLYGCTRLDDKKVMTAPVTEA